MKKMKKTDKKYNNLLNRLVVILNQAKTRVVREINKK